MTQQQKANAGQQQKLKKYLVFAVMFLVFAGSMWWIFAPSKSGKDAQQGVGFNADIPDPKGAEIVGDKKTAYEQEQARSNQDEKMRSLQDYSYLLGERNNPSEAESVDIEPATDYSGSSYSSSSYGSGGYSGYSGWRGNSFDASQSAYMDINRTLGSFYDEPQEDPEKEELREEIEQLKAAMAEQQKVATSYDDQVALLEKSYELAAKYMPGTNGTQSATDNASSENNATSGKRE
jgi:conjugative transposon TraM protein